MDFLTKLDSVETIDQADFTVQHPQTNDPLMILVLAGPTHPNTRALAKKHEGNLAQALARARDPQKVFKNQYAQMLDPEDRLEREIEALVARTLDWKAADGSKADTPFDKSLMESIYRKRGGADDKEWLCKQVLQALGADDLFTRSSQTKS
jgi:hypothetical protein